MKYNSIVITCAGCVQIIAELARGVLDGKYIGATRVCSTCEIEHSVGRIRADEVGHRDCPHGVGLCPNPKRCVAERTWDKGKPGSGKLPSERFDEIHAADVAQCGCRWERREGIGDVLMECPLHAAATRASVERFDRMAHDPLCCCRKCFPGSAP